VPEAAAHARSWPAAASAESAQDALFANAAETSWDVTNQAAVRLWYPDVFGVDVEPLTPSADVVATWPETATAVAVRLLARTVQ
jgi:uncharacterized protein